MEMRFIGNSGLKVSALAFGTMTFGGKGQFRQMGSVQVDEARRHVNLCLEAGVNFFDTADVYSQGASEEILGRALGRRRDDVILATKAHGRMGDGPNDVGQSRHHIIRACEDSLRRLGTDYIDLYQLHGFDALTPLEETLGALDDLVRSGKVRYIGCSNYSAWHLMKALHVSESRGLERFISQQVYYSLVARELEYELVPLSRPRPRHPGLEPAGGRLSVGQVQARAGDARWYQAFAARRPRDHRRGERLRHNRSSGRDRPRARRHDRPGGVELGLAQARGNVGYRRRAHRGAAQGQPRRGELEDDRRGGAATGRGQRHAADLPVLASAAVQLGAYPSKHWSRCLSVAGRSCGGSEIGEGGRCGLSLEEIMRGSP